MKRAFLLVSVAIIIVLASSPVYLTADPRPFLNQHVSVSEDTTKTNPTPLFGEAAQDSEGERGLIGENCTNKVQVEAHNESSIGDDNIEMHSNENPIQSGIEESSNESSQSTVVPIPNGRIFYRGEPPYGYVPTSYPKQNISLPPVPLDLDP